MGQTLTHGIYLPNEGERNCYDGLAGNWSILDGAVGTVAEHTSALSGKAPLVHTHVKADITDLFNSANTWTGDNTYTKYQNIVIDDTEIGVAPNAQNRNGLLFKDKNGVNIGWLRHQYDTSGDISIEMLVSNKYKNGALDPTGTQAYQGVKQTITSNGTSYFNWSGYVNNSLYPYTTETFNIGDSTHQWNNLYAKNYYYNGVAWGLDKANTWTQNQVIASSNDKCYFVKDTIYELGQDYPNGEHLGGLTIHDKNGATVGLLDIVDRSYGNIEMRIRVQQKFDPNSNNRSTSGNILFNEIILGITPTKANYIGFNADLWGANTINLGTSTHKWKSLNGINPGALSLPKSDTSVTAISTSGFSFDGSNERVPDTVNLFSNGEALVDGWLCARVAEGTGHYVFINSDDNTNKTGILASCFSSGVISTLAFGINVYVPVKAGNKPAIRWAKPNGGNAQLLFYPCFGNV